jgi:hypothetical protein
MKTLKTLAIALFITITSSCQNKKNMTTQEQEEPKFEWEEGMNSPEGYPMEVYRGGFDWPYISLNLGTTTGEWGNMGGGMSHSIKPLPSKINCIWVSYAERCHYKINTEIDYDKLLKLFQEGYPDSNRKFGKRKTTFNHVVAGFAPGGVVVVWAAGAGRQVEIGRYKGEKFVVPQAEIDGLDASERLLFSEKEYDRIMNNTRIVPLEVCEANAGKPIPYGLWDSYRTRYSWRPVVEVQNEAIILNISFDMFNGEKEALFDKTLIENKFEKRGILSGIGIGWRDAKGQGYGGLIYFNEEEIRSAFKKMYKDIPDAESELVFTVNHANNFITVLLKCGDKKIRFIKNNVEVFKSRKNSLNN